MTQLPKIPDTLSQRAAMKKLGFLVGQWAGTARLLRGPGPPVELSQTEEVAYRLDALVLVIEGIGRETPDGRAALQALGFISYDDESETYVLRAFNDGRYLKTELRLTDDENGILWGFAFEGIRTNSVLRINEEGDWTELTEIMMGDQPPRKLMELKVTRRK